MRKKIAFDAKRALLNHSGLGNYSRQLICSLLQFFPENEYSLFSTKPNESTQAFIKTKAKENLIFQFPKSFIDKSFKAWWRRKKITKELYKNQIDLYHGLSHELPIGIEKISTKSVVSIHDLIFERYPNYYPAIDRYFYSRKIKHACAVADKIVAISEQTKNDLVSFYDISADKIEVIYQSCNALYYEGCIKDASLIERFNLPEKYLLCVGSYNARKNHIKLLRAFQKISATCADVHLVLVGKGGDQFNKVKEFISTQHLTEKVRFVQQCNEQELKQIYLHAQMLIYPSEFEGFGIPILEAFATNIPVITSDKAIFREAGGQAAIYVNTDNIEEMSNKINELLNNSEKRRDHIEKGKQQLSLFAPEKIAKAYMALYQSILSS